MNGAELVDQSIDTLDIAVDLEDLETNGILESFKVIQVWAKENLSRSRMT